MTTRVTNIDAGIRRREAALRASLREFLRLSGQRENIEIEQMADPIDQVRSSTDRELTIQRLDQQAHLIHEIQSALARIEEGSYGSCEQCDQPISPKRLEALPWARLCVKCQSAAELESSEGPMTFHSAA